MVPPGDLRLGLVREGNPPAPLEVPARQGQRQRRCLRCPKRMLVALAAFGSTMRLSALQRGSIGLHHDAPADGARSPGATPSAPLGLLTRPVRGRRGREGAQRAMLTVLYRKTPANQSVLGPRAGLRSQRIGARPNTPLPCPRPPRTPARAASQSNSCFDLGGDEELFAGA
jgi:hypothetical protein